MVAILEFLTSPEAIGGYIAASVGALAVHLFLRYVNRMSVLRWSVTSQRLAYSGESPSLGKVEVRYNEQPVRFVFLQNLELGNESSRDLEAVSFRLSTTDNSWFAGGSNVVGLDWVPWTPRFLETVRRVSAAFEKQEPPAEADLNFVRHNRESTITALNRGTLVRFEFLVFNDHGVEPRLAFVCEKLGVRTRHQSSGTVMFGVSQKHALIVGLVLGLALILLIGSVSTWATMNAILGFIVGISVAMIGVAAIHAQRLVKRAIG
jgi:hypothetical protein